MTSACLPEVAVDPTTTVWATSPKNPSIWTPRSILATSPSLRLESSDFNGEKWPTTLLTEIQVGKAIPFSIYLFFVNTFVTSLSISASPNWQRSEIEAPGTNLVIKFSKTLLAIFPAY